MTFDYVLAIDPSGNFYEGKGTTGLCLFNANKHRIVDTKSITAKNYDTWFAYWKAVVDSITNVFNKYKSVIVVIEDYTLYATKAASQINSKMETPKLIGVLEYYCKTKNIQTVLQPAHMVKNRWANEILTHCGYIKLLNKRICTANNKPVDRHAIDAIRHAVHYATFKNK